MQIEKRKKLIYERHDNSNGALICRSQVRIHRTLIVQQTKTLTQTQGEI